MKIGYKIVHQAKEIITKHYIFYEDNDELPKNGFVDWVRAFRAKGNAAIQDLISWSETNCRFRT
jgi:hypothetical protein